MIYVPLYPTDVKYVWFSAQSNPEGVWGVKCVECRHESCGSNDPSTVEHSATCSLGDGTEGQLLKGL